MRLVLAFVTFILVVLCALQLGQIAHNVQYIVEIEHEVDKATSLLLGSIDEICETRARQRNREAF